MVVFCSNIPVSRWDEYYKNLPIEHRTEFKKREQNIIIIEGEYIKLKIDIIIKKHKITKSWESRRSRGN